MNDDELQRIHAWWRAANYLAVGQIYLLDNPLLRKPLTLDHIKPRLLGHWGTTPGLSFIYAHLNRILVRESTVELLFMAGPGHGGPALVACAWLEGSYSEFYPDVCQDGAGMQRLFKQFSFPGGIGSHATPEVPGSIHEGGELGYSLAHAYGAAFDNPSLVVACVVGDGEAETGPLAAAWHSNKFLDPRRDGAVLPILHLNGYKIANPTVLARIPHAELESLMIGYGYRPYFVEGDDPVEMHRKMAGTMDAVFAEIRRIQSAARTDGAASERPAWPMIVLRSPKGWTGPKVVDGKKAEGSWRSHQVPLSQLATNAEHREQLEAWLRSYRPEELFDADGRPVASLLDLPPKGERRMSATPYANGGTLLRDLELPDYRDYAVEVSQPGAVQGEATRVLGRYLRDVMRLNRTHANFRVFGPDEVASNRLDAVFEASDRVWLGELLPDDDHLSTDGRVMEVLSEHLCEGWLEGYLLSGRHGFFTCYEAFIHIIDSMFNQHAKWLKVAKEVPWRKPVASLNILLTSHVWRQDHNGFSHQDPGFIDHVVNKKADIIRVYLPPDANTLLAVSDRCMRSRNLVNVIVAGKQPQAQWLDKDQAQAHCERGLGIWEWAGNDGGEDPDVVLACAGDVPTMEALAASEMLRQLAPKLRVRFVNVVDLMTLQPQAEHPHGLSEDAFDAIFTRDKPILFIYHGYPWLIHRLTYRHTNHEHLHVRGYKEEGTTTTPFDMAVCNDIDRFHILLDVVHRVPQAAQYATVLTEHAKAKLAAHAQYIVQRGEDMPEVRDWHWQGIGGAAGAQGGD